MIIRVQYTTQLKAAIGHPEESIAVADNTTLQQLMKSLADRHPEPFQELVFDDSGNLLPSILLCVDDKQVNASDALELSDGTVVTFLSAISGG
jgi:molybdopterin converting factor small subunit